MPTALKSSNEIASGFFRKYLKRKNELQEPWSIVELEITESEFSELRSWVTSFDQKMVQIAHNQGWSRSLDSQGKFQNTVVCGFLLHILYAEHVRRYGSEGNYWGSVSKLEWTAYDRHLLFNANSQPTQFHRRLLERAAQQLKMRHAFGVEGTPQWFSTGYLQFGFTKKGFLARLPEWLSAPLHSTTSIETLCSESISGSESFRKMWSALSGFRRGNIQESSLRQHLNKCCWVLPEWHDELVSHSKKRAYLGTDTGYAGAVEFGDAFLSSPRLVFTNHGDPGFEMELINLVDLALSAPEYRVVVNEGTPVRLIRQEDGSYVPNTYAPIRVSFETEKVNASLEDATTGALVTSQNLLCWDSEDLVCVFKGDGVRYADPTAVKTGNQDKIFLLYPSALMAKSSAPDLSTWISPCELWTISEIRSSTSFELCYEGDLVWTLEEARLSQSREREIIRDHVKATAKPVKVSSGKYFSVITIQGTSENEAICVCVKS